MPTKKTREEFIEDAKKVHGDRYSYDKVNYINAQTKVTIICNLHGEFEQKPCSHTLSKQGCPDCGGNIRYTTESYIQKAKEIHNNKYSYELTNFTKMHNNITITCLDHGNFEQKAYVHMQNHGCPLCGNESIKIKNTKNYNNWSYSGWETRGFNSPNFSGFSLYVIECWNDEERFIKIGKTFTSLHIRFNKSGFPYEWKLLKMETGSAKYISELEAELHKKYKHNSYQPTIKFNGRHECFCISIKETINEFNAGTANNT